MQHWRCANHIVAAGQFRRLTSPAAVKILIVASKFLPEYSGAGLRIKRTYERLRMAHPELSIAVLCGATEYQGDQVYEIEGVPVQRVASRLFGGWQGYRIPLLSRIAYALRSYCEGLRALIHLRRNNADVLHIVGSSAVTATAIGWGSRMGKPIIIELVTAQATPWQYLPGMNRVFNYEHNAKTVVVAISRAIAESLPAAKLNGPLWLRPNPVETKRFFPAFEDRDGLRREHTPFGAEDCVLCSVAKLTPQKNHAFLIEVLASLPERFKLVIAGPLVSKGPQSGDALAYLEAMRLRARELAVEDRLVIVSEFVDAAEFIKLADIFVMPARNEGLGTPALEAMACGIPVVANRGEACFREWVIDGEGGLTADLEPALWCEAILRASKLDRQHMQAVAHQVAQAASVEMIDGTYWKLLDALRHDDSGIPARLREILPAP
jgi:glycosyltransferase involved in cell wall biosynthesis